ncbi:MAG: hypothetical protein LBP59_08435 [Planctomycetaceae bacterium]|nr:hypothetical protein [Planctomycetaceae bacterium]
MNRSIYRENLTHTFILFVLEFQRFKSVKACRPKARQAKVNENSSVNSLSIVVYCAITFLFCQQKNYALIIFVTFIKWVSLKIHFFAKR